VQYLAGVQYLLYMHLKTISGPITQQAAAALVLQKGGSCFRQSATEGFVHWSLDSLGPADMVGQTSGVQNSVRVPWGEVS